MSPQDWIGVLGFALALVLFCIKIWETFFLKADLHVDVVRGVGRELGRGIGLIDLRVCLANRGRVRIALSNFRLKAYFPDKNAAPGFSAKIVKNFDISVRLMPRDLLVEDFTYELEKATKNWGRYTLTLEWQDDTGQRYVVQHPEFTNQELNIDFGQAKVISPKYAGEIEPMEL